MILALEEAQKAFEAGEVPVGAVVTDKNGIVLAAAHNLVEARKDPTAHAEMLAMAAAREKKGDMYLEGCTLTVTLEPCALCAQGMAYHRLAKVVFGAYDPKSGGVENGARIFQHSHHKPEVIGGIMEIKCSQLLKDFFKDKRA